MSGTTYNPHQPTINLGNPVGDVGVGDQVICGGDIATVTGVTTRPPGHAQKAPTDRQGRTHAPIANSMTLVEVRTTRGTRYLGAERAWIGPDLRMHWER